MKQAIVAKEVQPPDGPFSLGIRIGNLLFVTGQVGIDAEGRVVGKDDPAAQADQALRNIQRVLEAAGGTIDSVAKLTVFLTDINDRGKVAAIRAQFFRAPYPASTIVEVSRLANADCRVAIEAIAVFP